VHTEITLNGSTSVAARYVGWAPAPAQVRLLSGIGRDPIAVTLRNQNPAQGGQVVFYAAIPGAGEDTLSLALPAQGTPVNFFIAGKWQRPSTNDRDAVVEVVVESDTNQVLGSIPLMVRIRKDAMTLTTAERDRFRNAFAVFNILGQFQDFRDAHVEASDREMHAHAAFLHWHRAFVLDLERELQRIDPSVTIPYWQWDRPAPSVFSLDFMGVTNPSTGWVQFSGTNPLQLWATDGVPGILRTPLFDTQTQGAQPSPDYTGGAGLLHTEAQTLDMGGSDALYSQFRRMESNPHGGAHASFNGWIPDPPTSPKDPIFFLLHSNLDRLWAKWQWIKKRFDVNSPSTFTPECPPQVGHDLFDTMWPWNGVTTNPRPATAPGGTLAPSPSTNAPGPSPRVRDVIDYQGVHTPVDRLGFDYDDVPFQFV
jgi:tyrosinase